jgi:hypothetical protein
MAKISKYIKVDKNILLEYIYNDSNLNTEDYKILIDSKNSLRSYISGDSSLSGNVLKNQLFPIDTVINKYTPVDSDYYSTLQTKSYSSGQPIRFDTIKLHIPINWTFGEYFGFYIRVYSYDRTNNLTFNISNFYFDMTKIDQQPLLNFSTPPLLFQETLWGKNISIDIPSPYSLSRQFTDGYPTVSSINSYLTDGLGLSETSPVFIEFRFIERIETINTRTNYLLGERYEISVPQVPEFENLGVKIQHSNVGDYFEIYGIYNGTLGEFSNFIDDSDYKGVKYTVQYDVTLFEQNIRGKTTTFIVNNNFNESIEWRPIVKSSTTTAVIDVEMKLIDTQSGTSILRRASYGILQDEVSKYSLNMTKINLSNANKPKIYNVKNSVDFSLLGSSNSMGQLNNVYGKGENKGISVYKTKDGGNVNNGNGIFGGGNVQIQEVKVPYPVLIDKFNIISKSDNAIISNNTFYGIGKMQILIYPFDNIVKFIVADGTNSQPNYLDLTNFTEIRLTFKNDTKTVDIPLFVESGDINLKLGQLIFKISESKYNDIKNIYQVNNLFYIIGSNGYNNNVIYTGLFKIYDSITNVQDLNNEVDNKKPTTETKPSINYDPNLPKETAVVTTKKITQYTNVTKKG